MLVSQHASKDNSVSKCFDAAASVKSVIATRNMFFVIYFFFYQIELHILLTKTKIYRNSFKKDIIKQRQNKYKSLAINLES